MNTGRIAAGRSGHRLAAKCCPAAKSIRRDLLFPSQAHFWRDQASASIVSFMRRHAGNAPSFWELRAADWVRTRLVWGFFCQPVVLGCAESFLFGAGKAVFRPVACNQVPGARGRGQGTETLAKLWRLAALARLVFRSALTPEHAQGLWTGDGPFFEPPASDGAGYKSA